MSNPANERPTSSQKADTPIGVHRAAFERDLRNALAHLYDPPVLRANPLMALFDMDRRPDAVSALQRVLAEAVETLKPTGTTPHGAGAWRIYRVLSQRYIEQLSQAEVSLDLGLSIRQLRREEGEGLQMLADRLYRQYHRDLAQEDEATNAALARPEEISGQVQELAWLKRTTACEAVDLAELVRAMLRTVAPLMQNLHVRADCTFPGTLPKPMVQVTTLRQALLSILTAAVRAAADGQVQIEAAACGGEVSLEINPIKPHPPSALLRDEDLEGLKIAQDLVALSGGALTVSVQERSSRPLAARLVLPSAQRLTVLVVDDNTDTLCLIERYLAGTRYRLVMAADAQTALASAEEAAPDITVLDVMLPGIDGWELLGRLREHPRLRGSAIIVCTILPQEQLALTLGASAFLRKPVSRQALLDVLDRQAARLCP